MFIVWSLSELYSVLFYKFSNNNCNNAIEFGVLIKLFIFHLTFLKVARYNSFIQSSFWNKRVE
jgi:hypothetical protein